ncbi:hypothetical protein [Rathayibacter festucae]|uniref:hypothetical protein n=1 Tax=Rathayibacter festucae TaxID=110937 RepID=UPI002A6A2B43|nr:hypothetical protein [Rathayibacter festucae]MDY0914513.1 hypothetical protein [Rathayibacter festucae]
MGGYDDVEDLPASMRPHRGVTVMLVVFLTIVLIGTIGVFAYALRPLGDSTSGSMPSADSGREVVYGLVPVLNDDAAIARLVPSTTAAERDSLRTDCGPLAGNDPDITILDGVTPASFRVVLEGTADPGAQASCWIRFRWMKGEGWHASAIAS